jgi:hypothetical protein
MTALSVTIAPKPAGRRPHGMRVVPVTRGAGLEIRRVLAAALAVAIEVLVVFALTGMLASAPVSPGRVAAPAPVAAPVVAAPLAVPGPVPAPAPAPAPAP